MADETQKYLHEKKPKPTAAKLVAEQSTANCGENGPERSRKRLGSSGTGENKFNAKTSGKKPSQMGNFMESFRRRGSDTKLGEQTKVQPFRERTKGRVTFKKVSGKFVEIPQNGDSTTQLNSTDSTEDKTSAMDLGHDQVLNSSDSQYSTLNEIEGKIDDTDKSMTNQISTAQNSTNHRTCVESKEQEDDIDILIAPYTDDSGKSIANQNITGRDLTNQRSRIESNEEGGDIDDFMAPHRADYDKSETASDFQVDNEEKERSVFTEKQDDAQLKMTASEPCAHPQADTDETKSENGKRNQTQEFETDGKTTDSNKKNQTQIEKQDHIELKMITLESETNRMIAVDQPVIDVMNGKSTVTKQNFANQNSTNQNVTWSPSLGRKRPCTTCESLPDRKPVTVNTRRMMEQVLRFCSQPGQDQQEANENDYICLSGVHLQNKIGKWLIIDGTEFHNSYELESSFERSGESDNTDVAVSGNRIAKAVRKNKRIKLGPTIVCDWIPIRIPNTKVASGRWMVFLVASEKELPIQNQEVSHEVPSTFEGKITVHDPGYVVSHVKTEPPFKEEISTQRRLFEKAITRTCFPEETSTQSRNQIDRVSLGDIMIAKGGEMISLTFKQFKRKFSKGFSNLPDLIPTGSSSPRQPDLFISNDLLSIRETAFVPLNRAITLIRQHLAFAVSSQHQYQLGNDEATTAIGWLIRNQFCKALENVLRIGIKITFGRALFLFGKPGGFSLWGLMKDVALGCKGEPVLFEIIRVVELSPFLSDDEIRFRCLICELLNSCNEDGSEKLLITWFRKFVNFEPVLSKYYNVGTFWRIQSELQTGPLVDELMSQLAELNGYPFNLHADFEFVQLKQMKEEKQKSTGFVLERKENHDDLGLFAFE